MAEADRWGEVLAGLELERSAGHAGQLRAVLALRRALARAGRVVALEAELALALRCSEARAGRLVEQAELLAGLPDGLAVLEVGLLTVEQLATFVRATALLPDGAGRALVWERLVARLRVDAELGAVLAPARLAELLRRWVRTVDADAVARRRRAEAAGAVLWRRRDDDGLVDITLAGVPALSARAVLTRLRALAQHTDSADERTADKRRLDAAVDLLLGRRVIPAGTDLDARLDPGLDPHWTPAPARPAGCGCPSGAGSPCGVDVQVLVPLGAALGTTDEAAELVGHGPLDGEQLRAVLAAAPRLRPVWVDRDGTPVAVGPQVLTPRRDDPADLRRALLTLQDLPPAPPHPRHPDDHAPRLPDDHAPRPPAPQPPDRAGAPAPVGSPGGRPQERPTGPPAPSGEDLTGTAHPPGTPGTYRLSAGLRRLIRARSPRCEWPGCGITATRCDDEHDTPWPTGPTCACNTGPLCRRHHRVKQTGWTKTRTDTDLRWTSPTGRTTLTRNPHQPPQPPARPLPPVPTVHRFDTLSPTEQEQQRWATDPTDPWFDGSDPTRPTLPDDPLHQPPPTPPTLPDTTWTHDLDDPHPWLG